VNVAYISCIIHSAIFALYRCGPEESESWVSQCYSGAGRQTDTVRPQRAGRPLCLATALDELPVRPGDCRDGRRDAVRQGLATARVGDRTRTENA